MRLSAGSAALPIFRRRLYIAPFFFSTPPSPPSPNFLPCVRLRKRERYNEFGKPVGMCGGACWINGLPRWFPIREIEGKMNRTGTLLAALVLALRASRASAAPAGRANTFWYKESRLCYERVSVLRISGGRSGPHPRANERVTRSPPGRSSRAIALRTPTTTAIFAALRAS